MRALILMLMLTVLTAPVRADLDSLKSEANIAAAAGEVDIAIGKLGQVLELAPEDGATHFRIAVLMMDNDGDMFDALQHFERARDLKFQLSRVAYRLSRLYARSGRGDDALQQLEVMAESGFGRLNLVEDESDYDSIRNQPRFAVALESIRDARFPCAADERHHAFDFWVGEWVVKQNGNVAGTSSVQPILGHCTVFEQWESANGNFGKSFNYYDPGHDHWRQIWIGDSGSFIEFTGVARDGGIFFTAETVNPADGSLTQHKFEFTVIGEDGVRQFWETSTDGGETWQSVWDGRYERKP